MSAQDRAADEIDVLWRGELVLTYNIGAFEQVLHPDSVETLKDLIQELHRIRMLRVQRQGQRRRAKQRKRANAHVR